MDTLTYVLEEYRNHLYPQECFLKELFNGELRRYCKVFREKVPNKNVYVIMKQQEEGLPSIEEVVFNSKTASFKVLEHSMKWIKGLLDQEKGLGLFLNYEIIDQTHYGEDHFKKYRKKVFGG